MRCLQVIVHQRLFKDRGRTLLRTVEQLPALTDLEIDHQGFVHKPVPVHGSYGLPRCKELARLRSCSLIRLRIQMLGGPAEGNTLRLRGLPKLRVCKIVGHYKQSANMRIDAVSFQELPQLQSLQLGSDETLRLQRGSLAHMTGLTSLRLTACGRRTVPPDVLFLSASLCELDLSDNDCLQSHGAALARILQCSRLRALSLGKPDMDSWKHKLGDIWDEFDSHLLDVDFTPSLWSSESVANLVQLPSAFRMRHGRDLTLRCD